MTNSKSRSGRPETPERHQLRNLLDEAKAGFEAVEPDLVKELVFGFTATLAVAELAKVPLANSEAKGTTLFLDLTPRQLAEARRRAEAVATSRYASGRAFGGATWHIIANGLFALEIERKGQVARDGETGGENRTPTARAIFAGVDRYIQKYVTAPPDLLERAGIAGAAKIVDGAVGARTRADGSGNRRKSTGGENSHRVAQRFRSSTVGLLVMIGLLIAAVAVQFVWAKLSGQRERNAALNPAVIGAFHAVERQCLGEQWPNETVRCRGALEQFSSCGRADDGCTAQDTYCMLEKLGFDMPDFYRQGTPYATEQPC